MTTTNWIGFLIRAAMIALPILFIASPFLVGWVVAFVLVVAAGTLIAKMLIWLWEAAGELLDE